MPTRALRPCSQPGCAALVRFGRCAAHAHVVTVLITPKRKSPYGWKWQGASKRWLASHPFCVYCEKEGRSTAASCVDHIVPHRGDMTLFWNTNNWASSCATCHSRKTASEDGGFGNPLRHKDRA